MRPDSQNAGRRRRGNRRNRNFGGRYPSDDNSNETQAPVKTGFFQKIIAFFTGKKAKPQQPGNGKSGGAISSPRQTAAIQPQTKSFRKPELVEVTSPKIYVGNLSFDSSESDLFELFAGVGSVQNAEIVSHRDTQKSKGFGFVTMSNVDEAKRAVAELHDKEFMGRRLVVSGARTNDVRDTR